MAYQLLVFDWDGTLFDSSQFIVNCVQQATEMVSLPVPAAETIKQMIGLSFDQALKRAMPSLSPMQMANLIQAYKKCVAGNTHMKPTLFPGATETLQRLASEGYWLAIATGKSRSGLNNDLAELGMDKLFLATRCAEETQSKPHPQMLIELMNEMGVTENQTLMIGDTEYDLQCAQNAKVDALGVLYGAHTKAQLAPFAAKHFLQDIRELPAWLATLKAVNM